MPRLAPLESVWDKLCPAEQARILRLLIDGWSLMMPATSSRSGCLRIALAMTKVVSTAPPIRPLAGARKSSGVCRGKAMDWRRNGIEEIEAQFNPRKSVPDFEDHQARHASWSAAARAELDARLDVPYGDGPLHKIDIFPAPGVRDAPVHVYFHGGYWRAQDKANFAHVAKTLVGEGICTVIANYDLCPAVTLDGTVASALRAVAWISRHAGDYGGDPDRLTLSGHSAGAHLCAMALARDWRAAGLPADVIKGAVPISGIFDPEPAMHTTVNVEIRLTEEIARRNDALRLAPRVRCPVKLFVGGDEPTEWVRQSELYAEHLRQHGLAPELTIVPGAHHFDILDQYVDPASPITRAVVELAHGRFDARDRRDSPGL